MTSDKKRKQAIRARMAKMGERYQAPTAPSTPRPKSAPRPRRGSQARWTKKPAPRPSAGQ